MSTAAVDSLASRFPDRATRWRLGTRDIEFPRRPLLMGIVNVTPDSFSDGGSITIRGPPPIGRWKWPPPAPT